MNYANADMVGHSGKLEATIKAVETVDECLGRLYQSLKPKGGAWIITADHGNAETMIDPSNRRPAHLSHHKSSPLHPSHRRFHHAPNSQRLPTRHRPNDTRHHQPTRAHRNDRPRSPRHHAEMNRPTPAETKLVICVWHPFDLWRPPPSMAEAVRKQWPAMRVVHSTKLRSPRDPNSPTRKFS